MKLKNMILRVCYIFLFMMTLQVHAASVRFCYESLASWGVPYYPKFTINNKVYFTNNDFQLNCYDLGQIAGSSVSLTTNGFNVDYRNNVASLSSNLCGFGVPCTIPTIYQNEELYYIHASVWPINNNTNLTGVLTAVYKPKA